MLNWCCIDPYGLLQPVRVLTLSRQTGWGDYVEIVLLIGGLPQERATCPSTHRRHTILERCCTNNSGGTPSEMCVYHDWPFVHSDISASEVISQKRKCGVKGEAAEL